MRVNLYWKDGTKIEVSDTDVQSLVKQGWSESQPKKSKKGDK